METFHFRFFLLFFFFNKTATVLIYGKTFFSVNMSGRSQSGCLNTSHTVANCISSSIQWHEKYFEISEFSGEWVLQIPTVFIEGEFFLCLTSQGSSSPVTALSSVWEMDMNGSGNLFQRDLFLHGSFGLCSSCHPNMQLPNQITNALWRPQDVACSLGTALRQDRLVPHDIEEYTFYQ